MLSVLQFSLHQNQDQQQEGEGPQQTLLEVATKEGSREWKPGAHGGLHVWKGACARLRGPFGVFTCCCSLLRKMPSGRALMTPEGPLKDSEVRPIDGSI